jgi:hypothetical protein
VRGVDGASWNNKRPAGVAFAFQVRKHLVEAHVDVPSNIFSNDPTGPEGSHEPMHFRPEVTVIFRASSEPGHGKWLARIAPCDDVNRSGVICRQAPDIVEYRHIRPVFRQDLAWVFLDLAERHGFKAASGLKPEAEAADAGEQVQYFEFVIQRIPRRKK